MTSSTPDGAPGGASAPRDAPAIEAVGIVKRFPGVVANAGVDFAVARGEVHALLGENGAGKSTLAAVLTGLYQPDAGSLRIAGETVRLRGPRDALALGVGMVHQHFRLVDRFTVAENVVLGDPSASFFLTRRRLERDLGDLGQRYGLHVDPGARVGDLSVGERQRVEIVKTLHRGADVLLLDEPTAVLTPQESEALFATVRSMAADGKAVVFISHKLAEVMAVADRVTVMRDGRVAGTVATTAVDEATLARMMVGRDVDLSPTRATAPRGAPVLSVRDLQLDVATGTALRDVSLDVHAGEIVGVAGVAGNGQVELAETVAGLRRPTAGAVRVCDTDVTGRGPVTARRAGLAYVPEDRLGTGLAPGLSIVDNLQLTAPRRFLLDRAAARRRATDVIDDFDVRTQSPDAPTSAMSGGNVQKVLLARELTGTTPALVVAAPTRGLDVGATEYVRRLLDQRRRDGCGILLISEDLDELRAMADRIVVLFEGHIALEQPADVADVTELGMAMAGAARPGGPLTVDPPPGRSSRPGDGT